MPSVDELIALQQTKSPFAIPVSQYRPVATLPEQATPQGLPQGDMVSQLAELIANRKGPSRTKDLRTAAPSALKELQLPEIASQFSNQNVMTTTAGQKATFFAEEQRQADIIKLQAEAAAKTQAANLLNLQDMAKQGSSPFAAPELKAQGNRAKIIEAAKKFIGTPYSWGGGNSKGPTLGSGTGSYPQQATTTVGFDCSGLVQYAYAQVGIKMPRVSYGQLKQGTRTAVKSLQPGDLVGFGDGHHIAIYVGNGKIIEAPRTGLNVRVRALSAGEMKSAWGVHLVM